MGVSLVLIEKPPFELAVDIDRDISIEISTGFGGITLEVPQRPISQAEYNKEMETILSVLPTAFRDFVSQYSWEKGHSAGYEEVISIARDLTDSLLKPIQSYKNALLY